MRLFVYDVSISMKSGNTLRFRADNVTFKWDGQQVTQISWPGSNDVAHITPSQVEAICARRILNWRRAFRG